MLTNNSDNSAFRRVANYTEFSYLPRKAKQSPEVDTVPSCLYNTSFRGLQVRRDWNETSFYRIRSLDTAPSILVHWQRFTLSYSLVQRRKVATNRLPKRVFLSYKDYALYVVVILHSVRK